jgi:hypothetical protein
MQCEAAGCPCRRARRGQQLTAIGPKAVHPLGDVLTVDEARRMAEGVVKLPEP